MQGIASLPYEVVEQPMIPFTGIGSMPKQAEILADFGRNGDTYIVHAAEGETVVPMEVFNKNPRLKNMLWQQMAEMGIEPERYIVGNELNSINPVTGQPEFFLKKIFKGLKSVVKATLPLIAASVGFMVAGPLGAKIGLDAGIAAGIGAFVAGTGTAKLMGQSWKGAAITGALSAFGMNSLANSQAAMAGGYAGASSGQFLPKYLAQGVARQTAATGSGWKGIGSLFKQAGVSLDTVTAPVTGVKEIPLAPLDAGASTAGAGASTQSFAGGAASGPPVDLTAGLSKVPPKEPTGFIGKTIADARTAYESASPLTRTGIKLAGGVALADTLLGSNNTDYLNETLPTGKDLVAEDIASGTYKYAFRTPNFMGGKYDKPVSMFKESDKIKNIARPPAQIAGAVSGNVYYDQVTGQYRDMTTGEIVYNVGGNSPPVLEVREAGGRSSGVPIYPPSGIQSIRPQMVAVNARKAGGEIVGPGTGTSDSIPAMLSDGEFVMTAKAVKNAGNGNRRAGAQKMYSMMKNLEKGAA
jgi:hypothetical protein